MKSYLWGIVMNIKRVDEIHKINYLCSRMDTLYHQASLKLGITDSVSIILYTIYDAGGHCLLSDIYKKSIISKQTVNSAIRGLEADGILYLEQHTGRSKKIILTEKGKEYVDKTVVKIYKAEMQAFESWPEEEINTYINLTEKYIDCFHKQIEKL
ncbi:MAG: MarR family winged helix-turn-helix transcriptional regulator [Brevinema sp.]